MIQLGTDKIFRGPRIDTPEQWNALLDAGVKTIINLERGYFETFHGKLNEEVRSAVIRGIVPIHMQLGDLIAPSVPELFCLVRMVQYAKTRGGVYFHCLWGKDRTGMMAAIVRVHLQGWKPKDAIDEMLANGFHEMPYRYLGWISRLEECLN